MFSCDEWNAFQWSKKAKGKQMIDQVFDKIFWSKVEEIVLFSEPLVGVLRMVDNDKPAMGFVYEAMGQTKEQIKAAYGDKRHTHILPWRIIDERWNKQLHRPLHAARYYLNPRDHYTTNFEVGGEVLGGLYKCIECIVPDSKAQDQIHNKVLNFNESIGTFGISMAIRNREKNPPGKNRHNLQIFIVLISICNC
eukprot:PITA_25704